MNIIAPVQPPPPGGRGASVVTGFGMFHSKAVRIAAVAGGGFLAVGLVAYAGFTAMQGPPERPPPAEDKSITLAQTVASPPPQKASEPKPTPPPTVVEKIVYLPAKPAPTFADVAPSSPPPTPPPPIKFVNFPVDGGEGRFDVPPPPPRENRSPAATGGKSPPPSAASEESEKTRVAFKGSSVPGGKAGPAIRLTYVMLPTFIPCTLEVAMDSTLPGAIMCKTAQDILSPEHVKLLPEGSRVVGTYKSDVKTGQNRLFAFVGNAFTPEGIPVPLDSGVSDGLGRSGIPGDVDNHYLERYGAAILLTGADTAANILQSQVSRGGNQYLNIGGGGGGSTGIASLTQDILRSQSAIQPTVTVPPGTQIMIVVDHPISFEDAYRIRNVK